MGNISIFITGRLFRGVSEIPVCRERKEERETIDIGCHGLIPVVIIIVGNNTRELGYLYNYNIYIYEMNTSPSNHCTHGYIICNLQILSSSIYFFNLSISSHI
jgi:hypothetical protein